MLNYWLFLVLVGSAGCAITSAIPTGQTFGFSKVDGNNYVQENCDVNFSGNAARDCDQAVYSLNKFSNETNSDTAGYIFPVTNAQ